ncbi:MAG: DEAD/DEAH box helicase [Candidatus Thorarchaeota archaeon]|nr:DEAD/DEAH box helicase [Candidatus Thorarchaeota archaeon]
MSVFDSLGPRFTSFLAENGIKTPTPIQEKAIPAILSTRQDMLLLAPTGSGKTEASLLPLLYQLVRIQSEMELFGFYILYITPLRALNRDVLNRIERLCKHLGLTVEVRHGDTTPHERRRQAVSPPNLLIMTPEALQAILPGSRLRYHLKTVFTVVVDEIHEIADSKRGTQLSLGLERLERLVGTRIQRIGLSATVGDPRKVAQLLSGVDRETKVIWAGYRSREMDLRVEMPVPSVQDVEISRRIAYPPPSVSRLRRIIELINEYTSTLVFTNTRSFAETLGAKMRQVDPPFEFDVHHGSLSKEVRLQAEQRIRRGTSKAVIATSSLELGIDIGQADLVVQYSSPRQVSRALQRAGRAGHGMNRVARAVLLATMNLDDVTECGVILRRARLNKVEAASIPEMSWDVLVHQICGILLDVGETDFREVYSTTKSVHAFRLLDESGLRRILAFMESRGLVRIENDTLKPGRRTRIFYYEHLSTIPDVRQVNAVDIITRQSIGVLDEDYVTENVETGSVFVIRGRPYRVVVIEEGEVICTPAAESDSDAPRWIGEMIPVPMEVATEVADVWNRVVGMDKDECARWLRHRYGLSDTAQEYLIGAVTEAKRVLGTLPSRDRVVIEDFGDGLVIHMPFGSRANETLGIVLAALITTRSGRDVGVERDPYRVLFVSGERIDPDMVSELLRSYDSKQASEILRRALRNTQTFTSRFVHVARRMGVIPRESKTKEIPVQKIVQAYHDTPVFEEAMREVISEKMDEKQMGRILDRLTTGKIEIVIARTPSMSPLARLIVEERSRFEVVGELTEEEEILRLIEQRLTAKRFRLVCVNGDWESVRTVSTLEDAVLCPRCGSAMIAALPQRETAFGRIVKKRAEGQSLSAEELRKYSRGMLTASLVAHYGKKALIVLAGRGIGPATASRILKPGRIDRHTLLRGVADAEAQYARTRQFWD